MITIELCDKANNVLFHTIEKNHDVQDVIDNNECVYQYLIEIYKEVNKPENVSKSRNIIIREVDSNAVLYCENPTDDFDDWKWN